MTCYTKWEIKDITFVSKENTNYEYLLHELFKKIKESRIFHMVLHILLHTSIDEKTID